MYKYRDVICPYCGHKFLWFEVPQEGISYSEYEDLLRGEICLSAKCPDCASDMIVPKKSLTGEKTDAAGYAKIKVRGI